MRDRTGHRQYSYEGDDYFVFRFKVFFFTIWNNDDYAIVSFGFFERFREENN